MGQYGVLQVSAIKHVLLELQGRRVEQPHCESDGSCSFDMLVWSDVPRQHSRDREAELQVQAKTRTHAPEAASQEISSFSVG